MAGRCRSKNLSFFCIEAPIDSFRVKKNHLAGVRLNRAITTRIRAEAAFAVSASN